MADKSPAFDCPSFRARALWQLESGLNQGANYKALDNEVMLWRPNPGNAVDMDKVDWSDQDGIKTGPGNSFNHKTEVNEVAYIDSHVKKSKKPDVGIGKDNIFTFWNPTKASNEITTGHKQYGWWYDDIDPSSLDDSSLSGSGSGTTCAAAVLYGPSGRSDNFLGN